MDTLDAENQLTQLRQALSALEAQRALLGDAVVDASLAALQKQIAELEAAGQPEQQRKLATILFMDIAGHTALTRAMDPEEVMEVIDKALARLAQPVVQYDGHIARYQGDGFKAVFGLPIAHENDPDNAVHAGLAILSISRQIAAELESERGLSGFAVRIGIDTGMVFAGGLTEGEDTVKGLPVNLAARLESAALPGTLLLSHHTYQHVRGVFDLQALEPVSAKGFDQPVPVYRVQAAKPRSFRTRRRGVEGIETRMVGRAIELQTLQNAFLNAIEDQQLQMVTIVADPGLGKSRLLYEFENWVDLRPGAVKLFRCRARLETQRLPYGLLRDLFAFQLGIQDDDPLPVVWEKFETHMAAGASGDDTPGSRQQGAEMRAHVVGHLLGYDFHASPYIQAANNDARQMRQQALQFILEYLTASPGLPPLMVLMEDLHWADDASLDAIAHLALALAGYPALIIATARPGLFERREHWMEGQEFHSRLELRPLSRRDSRQLVEEVLQKVDDIPESLRQLLVSNAEGNPFYVEELVKMLIEEGVIIAGEERWQVQNARLEDVHVPPTLTGVLQARLDSLPQAERAILQQASVVGRVFWDRALLYMDQASVLQGPGGSLEAALSALRHKEMIYQRDLSAFTESHEHIFKHALLREVTYESVIKRLRRAYHRQVAEWLEATTQASGRVDEYTAVIAEHYALAGEPLAAADWFTRAGVRAMRQGATLDAGRFFARALELLPPEEGERRWKAFLGHTDVLGVLGEVEARRNAEAQLIALAGELQQESYLVEAYHRQANSLASQGDDRGAVQAFDMAIATARRIGDQYQEARGLAALVISKTRLGELEEAGVYAEQAIHIAMLSENDEMKQRVFTNTAVYYTELGDLARAAQLLNQSLEIFSRLSDLSGKMVTLSNLGYDYVLMGMTKEGLAALEQSFEIAEMSSARRNRAYSGLNLGLAYFRGQDYAAARGALERALPEISGVGDEFGWAAGNTYLGLVLEGAGNIQDASQCFRLSRETLLRIGVTAYASDALAGLARCALGLGQLEVARQHAGQLWEYLQSHTSRGMEFPILAYLTCAQVFEASGEAERRRQALQAGYEDLMERAEKISDPEQRLSYLEKIPEHQKIVELLAAQ